MNELEGVIEMGVFSGVIIGERGWVKRRIVQKLIE